MASILRFPQGKTRVPRKSKPQAESSSETGEIVIFPGIRFEYWEEAAAPVYALPAEADYDDDMRGGSRAKRVRRRRG